MRPLPALLGLLLVSCGDEPPPLQFRAPQFAQTPPETRPQSEPLLVIPPKSEPASSSQPAAPFYCELDGKPWPLAPEQKLQGLLLQRPGLSKDQPSTKLISISLQGASKERLLLEISADTPSLDTARLTFTTKDSVAKASVPLREVEQTEAAESTLLSFSFEAKLQTLGSPTTRALQSCRLQGVVVRSLQAEIPSVDE